jgi:putative tryptophan/tyrosine transport system substrate-binding protein
MRRREFISLLGGVAVAWPVAARAQQSARPVIGFLCSGTPETDRLHVAAALQGLNETGYVEGRNLTIEYRWAEGQYDRLSALATDLVRRQVSLILAIGTTPAAFAAKSVTTVVPIVFVVGSDPVKIGLVSSLNRPGGNLTGVSFLNRVIIAKQLEILHEAVPKPALSGFLVNPTSPFADSDIADVQGAADKFGQKLSVVKAATENDIELAFTTLVQQGVGSLLVAGDLFYNAQHDRIVALAGRHAMPVLYPWREAVVAGGLISYGANIDDAFRQGGIYAGKILKGEKPADLPIQLGTKVELIINLKTAKALGITVPLPLIGRADELIE